MMTDREISLKSIIFLIIGILLILSLVVCIYLVNSEKDLIKISATVTNVKEDSDGTGKNNITVSYSINNIYYDYSFNYKDAIKINDKVDIYYHEKEPVSVQSYKTSKFIFVCPIVGLVLCIIGLIELKKKSNVHETDEEDYETKVISVTGDTQQLRIITSDEDDGVFAYTEEPADEIDVKLINTRSIPIVENELKIETSSKKSISIEYNEPTTKKAKIKKVTPVDYYINNDVLVYKDTDNEYKDIDLRDVEKVIKKINDNEDEIINIIIYTRNMKCTLAKIKNVDLDNIDNLLHNKLLSIGAKYLDEVEHKKY